MADKRYMTWLAHGGAFIDEMRILIDKFDPERDIDSWVEEITHENILGKRSRSWTREIVRRYFLARFVTEDSGYAWKPLKILCSQGVDLSIIRPIMYYHTAKIDDFLYDFVTADLFDRYYSGLMTISANDVFKFIEDASPDKFEKPWSDSVKGRLSRGVMSTLRDFGILEGKSKKRIADFYLPIPAFVYVAFLLHSKVSTGELVVNHDDWKLYLLKSQAVERMFLEAHQSGYLRYNAAGKLIRIEFKHNSTEELANAIATGAS
jgi:hypothetical protein